MGKTDSIIDVVLSRLDQRLVPIIYAGPARNFVTDQFEPHFDGRSIGLSSRSRKRRGRARCSGCCAARVTPRTERENGAFL